MVVLSLQTSSKPGLPQCWGCWPNARNGKRISGPPWLHLTIGHLDSKAFMVRNMEEKSVKNIKASIVCNNKDTTVWLVLISPLYKSHRKDLAHQPCLIEMLDYQGNMYSSLQVNCLASNLFPGKFSQWKIYKMERNIFFSPVEYKQDGKKVL